MTGEITLSGLVLPVGGIREKALAARRYGIKTFILPEMNEQDLAELPAEVRSEMTFVPAAHARGRAQGRAAGACRVADPTVRLMRLPCGHLLLHLRATASATPRGEIEIINALRRRRLPAWRHRRPHAPRRAGCSSAPSRPPLTLIDGAVRHRRRPDRQPAARRTDDDRATPPSSTRRCPTRVERGSACSCAATMRGSSSPTRRRSPARRRRRRYPVGGRLELHLGLDLRRRTAEPLAPRPDLIPTIRDAYAHAPPQRGGCRCTADSRRSPRSSTCRSSRGTRTRSRARRAAAAGTAARRAARARLVRRLRPARLRST